MPILPTHPENFLSVSKVASFPGHRSRVGEPGNEAMSKDGCTTVSRVEANLTSNEAPIQKE